MDVSTGGAYGLMMEMMLKQTHMSGKALNSALSGMETDSLGSALEMALEDANEIYEGALEACGDKLESFMED